MGISTAYDDNMLSSTSRPVGNFSYLFSPTLELVQTRGQWQWDVSYSPGFTINQRLSERNQSAHDLHLVLGYRVSPHLNLQLHDTFSKTTSLFADLSGGGTGQPGPLQQPNTSPITPVTRRTGNTSGLDLTYQLGRDSMVGASGGYYFVDYGRVNGSSGQTYRLINTRSWNADGFYTHRFGGRQWLGVSYNVQRLMFDPGSPTDVQRALLFYSVFLGSHMSFSLWAGPERSSGTLPLSLPSGLLTNTPHWNGAGGLQWNWEGVRTALSLSYNRQTTDGGGLAQAVRMNTANAELRRQLTRRWSTRLGAMYATNDSLNSAIRPLQGFSGTAGLDYQMTEHLALGLRYARYEQRYSSTTPGIFAHRNRGSVSISYSFSRPLGR